MGPEARLRDIIVQTLKQETTDKTTVWAGKNDDKVWTELFTHPMRQSQTKLVTVRDAHKIKNWKPLDVWLKEMRNVKVIMEADKPLFSVPMARNQTVCVRNHENEINVKIFSSGKERRTCKQCDDAQSILSKRGRLVLCAAPKTDAAKKDAIQMICSLSDATLLQAKNLLERTNWRLDAAIEVTDKLNLLNAPMTANIISALGMSVDETKFEVAMREGKRADAITAAAFVSSSEVTRVLDRLEEWLTQIARVHQALKIQASTSEIATAINADWGLTMKLKEWAERFDNKSIYRATFALANAQRDWDKGARIGVLEVLANQW